MEKVKSQVEGNTLVVERSFNAPRELVFEAFSTPAHLETWWGPTGWKTEIRTFEFEPGGTWHYCMTCVDKGQGDYYGSSIRTHSRTRTATSIPSFPS